MPPAGLMAASGFRGCNVSNCTIMMGIGVIVLLTALVLKLLGVTTVSEGDLLFIGGVATLLAGVICHARVKD